MLPLRSHLNRQVQTALRDERKRLRLKITTAYNFSCMYGKIGIILKGRLVFHKREIAVHLAHAGAVHHCSSFTCSADNLYLC